MLASLYHNAAARLAMALVIVMLGATSGFAGSNNRKPTVVVHPRYMPYVPASPYALAGIPTRSIRFTTTSAAAGSCVICRASPATTNTACKIKQSSAALL
jgi:hypothetical protein